MVSGFLLPAGLRAGAPPKTEVKKGSITQLPIDASLLGAWWRPRHGRLPAEAVHYTATGHFVRVTERGEVERGIWVSLVRKKLRWLRRCPAEAGASVSPGDCSYFGRYLLAEGSGEAASQMVEEEVCPEAVEDALKKGGDFAVARSGCSSLTLRFQDEADESALLAKAQEAGAQAGGEAPDPVTPPPRASAPPKDPRPAAPAGHPKVAPATGGSAEDMVGIWVGHLGAGPEKVTLTFHAAEGGRFTYTLEAGGQEETSQGDWEVDNSLLILRHPDGEVEKIPFSVEGDTLRWSDEDLGSLLLSRGH